MKIDRHLQLTLLGALIGGFVGFFGVGFSVLFFLLPNLPTWGQFIALAAGGTLGYQLSRWAVRHYLIADCVHCGGKSRATNSSKGQVIYTCTKCGSCVETGVSEGNVD